jgi:hypothetical protein
MFLSNLAVPIGFKLVVVISRDVLHEENPIALSKKTINTNFDDE